MRKCGYILFSIFFFFTLDGKGQQIEQCAVRDRINNSLILNTERPLQERAAKCIPVVVHIVYQNEVDNISDLQVQAQIDVLNNDFNLFNENISRVPSAFRPFMAASGYQFCLVSESPDGTPTSGVTHTQTSIDFVGTSVGPEGRKRIHYDFLDGQNAWFPNEVINIWVGQMESVIGFTTFPNEAPFPEEDGIIVDTDFFSAIRISSQASNFNEGHTLTHEMGHFFNLNHIWGDRDLGCESDDGIEDTPLQEEPYFRCPTNPQISCDTRDMFMNFMDFTNDRCVAFFTKGQIEVMDMTLQNARSGILQSNVPTHSPHFVETSILQNVQVIYLPGKNEILLDGLQLSQEEIIVECFLIDGKMIHQTQVKNQYTHRIQLHSWEIGLVFIRLSLQNEMKTFKVLNIKS